MMLPLRTVALGLLHCLVPVQSCVLPQLPAAHPRHYADRHQIPLALPPPTQDINAIPQPPPTEYINIDISIRLSPLPDLLSPQHTPKHPILPLNFPDPSILYDPDSSTFYAFATAGNGRQVQAATAPSVSGPWTYLSHVDPLRDTGAWSTGDNTWAPDVRRVAEGRYVMYYAAPHSPSSPPSRMHYCVGVAVSSSPLGPYTPDAEPWLCAEEEGGIIDPSGFLDPTTGRRYVVYKIDGNSIGHGGSCNNGVAPVVDTPIMLQEVGPDGIRKIGTATEILDREDGDGPLVEAPSLAYLEGRYVLFYSSHCWTEGGYGVNYAVAERVEGPYRRGQGNPLAGTGDWGLRAPGGATVVEGVEGEGDGGRLVFHADCGERRCMFEAGFEVVGA